MLMSQPPKMLRGTLARAAEAFAAAAEPDGKTAEVFSIIYPSGWAPDASHPPPARRGSATVSLANAFKPNDSTARITQYVPHANNQILRGQPGPRRLLVEQDSCVIETYIH